MRSASDTGVHVATESMHRSDWINAVDERTDLTRRQAEAYHLTASGYSREEAAERMGCSPSNVDNLRRAVEAKIDRAEDLLALVDELEDETEGSA